MTQRSAVKPLPRIDDEQKEALYQRYIAPVAAVAAGYDAARHFLDSLTFYADKNYSANGHVIADVIAWAYAPSAALPAKNLMTMIRLLDAQAERQRCAHGGKRKEMFFGPALVEMTMTDMNQQSSFGGDYLFYQAMAVMQMAIVLNDVEQLTEGELSHHFLGMRVNLERSNFSLIMLMQEKTPSLKTLGKKGGKNRSAILYGPARAYTEQRCREIRIAKPKSSKRQIAKIIEGEASEHIAFRVMSAENRSRTIYEWVLKYNG